MAPYDDMNMMEAMKAPATSIKGLRIKHSDIRSVFKESAYWKSDILLKPHYQESFNIKLPDNLTRWRLIVLATDITGNIDSQSVTFETKKQLEVRLDTPTQLTVGDHFTSHASVLSRSEEPVDVTLAISAQDKSKHILSEKNTVFQSVNAFDSNNLPITLTASKEGEIQIIAAAATNKEKDAIVKPIVIKPTTELKHHTYYGVIPEQLDYKLYPPLDMSGDLVSLDIDLSASIASQLNGTFNYMINYPHQCWEQKSSRAIAAAIQLASGGYQEKDKTRLLLHTFDALESIGEFQSENGGMSFFKPQGDHSNPYLTAYTYKTQLYLQELGYTVNTHALSKIKTYLVKQLSNEKTTIELKNIIINSLIKSDLDKEFMDKHIKQLINDNEKLAHYGKGLLLDTLSKREGWLEQYNQVKDILLSNIRETNKKIVFKTNDKPNWNYLLYNAKSYCSVINGLVSGKSDKAIIHKLINAALEYRRDFKGDFGNTISNSYCLMALKAFMDNYENSQSGAQYVLSINDQKRTLGNNQSVSFNDLNLNEYSALTVQTNDSANAYLQARIAYTIDRSTVEPFANGLSIKRSYFKYHKNQWELSEKLIFDKGEWIKIRLEIDNPIMKRFIAVTDFIPGGLNSIDKSLSNNAPVPILNSLEQSYYFSEQQLTPETAKFYAEFLPSGKYVIEYLTQAQYQGNYSALSAKVEEMYDDDIYGNSESVQITIE